MSTNLRITIGLIVFAVLASVGIVAIANAGDEPVVSNELLVRPDSHKLTSATDGKATLVEFLDFECEACRALYPAMEKLRKEYDGRITFVVRYFPLPSHANGELAARVVESAAAQGKFEAMYQKLYETQGEWGEQGSPQEALFLDYARAMGLDMAAFQAKLADPATAERVAKDMADGRSLGVDRTPTVYFNGEHVKEPSYASLKSAVDAALAS
ncbi:thioredoxin domain-containing protein [Actinorhabdospora filicis]|nr:thioredoxin domain-containing protein [Actinorhabdospora filicis]